MNADRKRDVAALSVGVGLIILGILFFLGEVFHFNIWGALWPFFIIVPGLLFFVAMVSIGKPGAPLAVPGSIVTTVGLLLFFQNVTGLWSTWAYAWALVFPTAVGIGIAIAGLWSDDTRAVRMGSGMAGVGLAILLFFAFFFEVLLDLNGLRSGPVGRILIPLLVIVAGGVLLVIALRPKSGIQRR